jgi:malate dehydrogenase
MGPTLLDVPHPQVKNVIIWGNHSSTQYPDVNHGTVAGKPIRQAVGDDTWLDGEFITTVQQRGAAIIQVGTHCLLCLVTRFLPELLPTTLHCLARAQARGLSSALSAASSACDHVRNWVLGTPADGSWVSMGVVSDGSYDTPAGLVYSFPVTCKDGKWSIVQGLSIDANSAAKMQATAKELQEERDLAHECIAHAAQA